MKKIILAALVVLAGSESVADEMDSPCHLFASSAAAAHSMAAAGLPLWQALSGVDKAVRKGKGMTKAQMERSRQFGRATVLTGYKAFSNGMSDMDTYVFADSFCTNLVAEGKL